ncbi:MAG: exodeoxyribonuclease V subunit gamma [Pseudonocardiales bacterium]
MLRIHRSERADPLVAALGTVLAAPDGDPFAAELVAVPSRGVERWLAQQLSHVLGARDGDGVCANVVFPSSSQLLDEAVAAADAAYAESAELWAAERAVWPLMKIIDDSVPTEAWAGVLAVHLGLQPGGADKGRRFAVASKLARHFVSYSQARPGMLKNWLAGRDEQGDGTGLPDDLKWQAELWRRLRAELGPSPAELVDDACATLRTNPAAIELPERFSIFGPTRLSPARVQTLSAVAEQRDVHLWLHHPSPALWDAVKNAGAKPNRRRSDAAAVIVHNPLLASLSRDIRELQQLLPAANDDHHHDVGTRPDTILGRLQTELSQDVVPAIPTKADAQDRSVTVHACHGPARQVEVIREIVLGLLKNDATLEPRDILIMCPDIEAFAPLVAASFGMADEHGSHPAARIRVRLADRSLRQTNPLLSLLRQLLELAANRVTATQVLDLAGAACVRKRFSFSDDDIEQLRDWTAAANARWGLDALHREPYGLGQVTQGTWRIAVDRLLLGVAMEEGDQWLGDVLPLDDVDSGAIDLAGRFAEFVARVDYAVRALEQQHTVPEWTRLLSELVLSLGEPLQAWQAVQLASELDDVAEAASETDVSLARADLAALMTSRLAGRPTRASFRTGTLTVCTLVPMRSVPHRVVCLVGMDDGAFPRHGIVDGDDVLARAPRTGERDVRSEDRQLFLDAVCAAQQSLVITYTGADPRTGAPVPPCVPLGELLDAVDASAQAPDGALGRAHVVIRHPLQPFDARNFTPDRLGVAGPFSFDRSGLAGARAASGVRHAEPALVSHPLGVAPPADTVDLDELIKFLQHPARAFLRQRLGISSWADVSDPADALPVALDSLQQWGLGERVLRQRLAGMSSQACKEIEHRRGDLPPGQLGRRLLGELGRTVDSLLAACEHERATPADSLDVSVPLDDGRRVEATVSVRGTTILSLTYSNLGPKQRLEAWAKYLAVIASGADPSLQAVSVGKQSDGVVRSVLRGVDPADARGILTNLVALRDTGLREPLPMAIKTSEAYAVERHRNRDVARGRFRAEYKWKSNNYPGEDADRAHVLVFGGTVTLDELMSAAPAEGEQWLDETTRFGVLACRLWTPLLSVEKMS